MPQPQLGYPYLFFTLSADLLKQKSKPIQSQKKRKVIPVLGSFTAYKKHQEEEEFRMSQSQAASRQQEESMRQSQNAHGMAEPNEELDMGASDGSAKGEDGF